MKITMIRHAKVKMRWPSRCNSEEFDAACQAYDKAEIVKPSKKPRKIRKAKVFISDLDRTRWTAEGLFRDTDFTVLGDIREVKMNSFTDTERKLPIFIWYFFGRLQWLRNDERQAEIRRDTVQRAQTAIDRCEAEGRDCILVTHGFFLKILMRELKKRGYAIRGNNRPLIRNLQEITAYKE